VDVGITTMSELISVNNVDLLGPVPFDLLPLKATTTAAIIKDSAVPTEAAALIQFLTSPPAMAVFKARGFEAN
jgi:ABC-type molybdate transport system substrate-binding protein